MTIARAAGSGEQLVQKFADEVAAGTPLVVDVGDAVILMRDNQAIRVIGPGSYTVPPELAGPGVAAFFVRTAPVAVKFGGPLAARPGGPRMLFGEAQIQAIDPCMVAAQLAPIGDSAAVMSWIGTRLKQFAEEATIASTDPDRIRDAMLARAGELATYGITLAGVSSVMAR